MKALAYRLRQRVDIEHLHSAQDTETGAVEETWLPFASKAAAEVAALSGREFVSAQAVQAGVTTRITVRKLAGLEPSMRVNHNGTLYNIKAILPDVKDTRHITLMCEAGVNEG